MSEYLVFGLLLIGSFLVLVAGIGVLRMPDLFLRMSATAKAGTLGTGLMVMAAAIYFNEFAIYTRALALIAFLISTAPVSTHMLGRAGYFDGVPLWEGTVQDDLRGHYELSTHQLKENLDPEQQPPISELDDSFETD
ncbi:MAG TPA: monovalent cation/H(+) antiporter subunit G [Anaerolineaceae bacterium]|nr:monovalent cation/H(+) antiporter subunit G [Anaerolineaceae bacterium]